MTKAQIDCKGFSCPLLAENDVHLWCADLDRSRWREEEVIDTLSDEERARAAGFRFAEDRRRFVASHALQRLILAGYLECAPGEVRYAFGKWGKPNLDCPEETTPLHFNMSHSRSLALYAVARGREVGVDIEWRRPLSDLPGIAESILTPVEMAHFTALCPAHREEAFFRAWVQKEAYVKATGKGLGEGKSAPVMWIPAGDTATPSRPSPFGGAGRQWSLCCFVPAPSYVAALVAEGRGYTIHHLHDLMI